MTIYSFYCDDCESILFLKCEYAKESGEEGKEDTIKLDKSRLVYSCKICGFQKSTEKQDRCLYFNDYSKDLLSNKIVTNPYVCLDPTLPILNTIKCPNSDCVVNKKDESLLTAYSIADMGDWLESTGTADEKESMRFKTDIGLLKDKSWPEVYVKGKVMAYFDKRDGWSGLALRPCQFKEIEIEEEKKST